MIAALVVVGVLAIVVVAFTAVNEWALWLVKVIFGVSVALAVANLVWVAVDVLSGAPGWIVALNAVCWFPPAVLAALVWEEVSPPRCGGALDLTDRRLGR